MDLVPRLVSRASVFASWCTYGVGWGDLWLHPIRGIWIFSEYAIPDPAEPADSAGPELLTP